MSYVAAGFSGFRFHGTASFGCCTLAQATWGLNGQPWFYRRLARLGRHYGFVGWSEGAYGAP